MKKKILQHLCYLDLIQRNNSSERAINDSYVLDDREIMKVLNKISELALYEDNHEQIKWKCIKKSINLFWEMVEDELIVIYYTAK